LGSTLSGLDAGFDTAVVPEHWRHEIGLLGHPTSKQLHTAFNGWLDRESDLPFFGYIHTLEVHDYFRPLFALTRPGWQNYDHAIRAQDGALAQLLADLEWRNRDVVLVLLSDHGESFGDHDLEGHGSSVYQSQTHVPLIFWSPGRIPAMTVNTPVSLVQLAPTLLDLFGLEPLPMAKGRSLLGFAENDSSAGKDVVFASREWYLWVPYGRRKYTAIAPNLDKVIHTIGGGEERYNIAADPCELVQLEPGGPAREALEVWIASRARERAEFEKRYGMVTEGSVDSEDLERLRALGYIP
jgi:arylsulfatase A-like enzyme